MSAKDKRKSGSTYRSIEANNKKLDAELFGESSEAGPSNIQTATSNVEFSEHPNCGKWKIKKLKFVTNAN